jgi:hypothetical protein
MRSRSLIAIVLAGAALVSLAGVAYLTLRGASKTGLPCQVVAGGRTYRLDREQAANAGVIAAAAGAVGLPHHAVTIGIAAALQESQLHNLTYGDRDSLGLFQQRPSQGWGSPTQILNPRFAAESFFRVLARTNGWSAMSVSDAAQRVQRSASPTAYATWENEARSLARATTGELPGALTCSA